MNSSKGLLSQVQESFLAFTVLVSMLVPSTVLANLEEIVVTARKKEVSLQDAAIAVSVFSGDNFDQSNVMRLDNFNAYVPGLNISKNDGAGRIVTIRGIGWETAQNLASQPSVLTYLDGVYLANPLAMGLDLGELERIEVFRGPQGTEFGQGTTGGAINLVSRKPELNDFSAETELGLGSYNTISARAFVNVPVGELVAMRASIQKYQRDGFAEIKGGALDGYDLDDADSFSGKLALLIKPDENFSMLAQLFVHESDQHAAAQKNRDDPNSNNRELSNDFPGIFNLDNLSASLVMDWQPSSRILIKSLTGFQRLRKEQTADGDRLTGSTLSIDRLGFFDPDNWDVLSFWDNNTDAFSQELNISYTGEKLDWVLGAYYLDHENFNDFLEATDASPFSAWEQALANPSPETLPPFQSALNFNESRTVTRIDKALYLQSTYQFSERYSLTAGLRYQDEKQNDSGEQFFGIFGSFNRDTNDSKLTWKAGLDIKLTESNLLYGLISTGWKNGGTNPGAVTGGAILLDVNFQPEAVTTYEIGSRNVIGNGDLMLNITVFYNDHDHLQYIYEDPVPFAGGTSTIPKLEEYGIETEFSFDLSGNWRLDGMLSWQDGQFKGDTFALDPIDFREALAPGIGLFTDAGFEVRNELASSTNLKGNTPPKLPKWMARLALNHSFELNGGGLFNSRIEAVYRGEMQARVFNKPGFDNIPSYQLVNLNFAYQMAQQPVSLSLTLSNVLDEDGINNIFNNPFGVWSSSYEFIPPREILGFVRYEWD